MSTPDASIDPRILESAKNAFLEQGYQNTQLKDICRDAGVTTGALYKRYHGKEDLFRALVEDAVEEIRAIVDQHSAQDPALLTDEELLRSWDMYTSTWSMQVWFDFLYARRDAFTLLLSCSDGTRYKDFLPQWVEAMTVGTFAYEEECVRRGMVDAPVSLGELQVLMSSFWAMIYQPFLLHFSKEELDAHCEIVCRMFHWKELLQLHLPD